jgi:hypothetical protein
MATLGVLSLICEISTVFLNYRSMYDQKDLQKPIPLINQLLFLITFTLTRMVMLPIIAYLTLIMMINLWDDLPVIRQVSGCMMFFISCMMIVLNVYWFTLILKGFVKALKAAGIIKDDKDDHQKDTYER